MKDADILRKKFKTSFDKNYAQLCRVAFRYVQNQQDAEDLVQDLFMKIWSENPQIFMEDGGRSYLFTSVKNNSITHNRRVVYFDSVEENFEEVSKIEDQPNENTLDDETLLDRIRVAIAALPNRCRTAFVLHKDEGLSYKQIAAELDISVKTVENHIGKALKAIREQTRLNSIILLFGLWIS